MLNKLELEPTWIDIFRILSYKIGTYLTFEERNICIKTHKSFENIHSMFDYQTWTLTESNCILKKYNALIKYKPRIKILEVQVNINLTYHDIIYIKNLQIDEIILNIKKVPELNKIITEVFKNECPINIHFNNIKQLDANDKDFYKIIRYQLDKPNIIFTKFGIELDTIKEFLQIFTETDILKINLIHINENAMNLLYNQMDIDIDLNNLNLCKYVYCNINYYAYYSKLNDIMTHIYDSSILTMNTATLNLLENYTLCKRLEHIYIFNICSQAIIIGKMIPYILNIPAKIFTFWGQSLLDPALYIVIKELIKANKIIEIYIHEDSIISIACALLLYNKCISKNLDIMLNISKKNSIYKEKTNEELLELINDENHKELFSNI